MIDLLGCDGYHDSPLKFSSATLTATFSETSVETDETTSVVRNSYSASGVATKTFARQAWNAETDFSPANTDGALPSTGNFYLLSQCCCYNFRFLIVNEFGGNTLFAQADIAYTETSGPSSPGGTILLVANVSTALPDDGDRNVFCLGPTREPSRHGQLIQLFGDVPGSDIRAAGLNGSYTDSDKSNSITGAGFLGDVTFLQPDPAVTPPNGTMSAGSSPSAISISAQQDLSGSDSFVSIGTDTITRNTTISLKVEFSMS